MKPKIILNKYLILIIILELLFLFTISAIQFMFFVPSAEAIQKAGEAITKTTEQMQESELYQLETLLAQNEEFKQAYTEVKTFMLSFLILSLFAYIILKTFSWYFTLRIIHKVPVFPLLIKFPLLTLLWTIGLILCLIIYATLPVIGALSSVLLICVYYLSQISYSLMPAQNTLKKTFKLFNNKKVFLTFALNTLILIIAFGIPVFLMKTLPGLAIILMAIISIPVLVYTRLNMIEKTWGGKDLNIK